MPPKTAKTYTTAQRAEAVARTLAGESPKSIARSLTIPESTIRSWRDTARTLIAEWADEERIRTGGTPKNAAWLNDEIWGLVGDSIAAIRAIARQTANAEWLSGQNAAQLAVLAGVLHDKLVRILSAIELQGSGAGTGDNAGSARLAERAGEAPQPEVD